MTSALTPPESDREHRRVRIALAAVLGLGLVLRLLPVILQIATDRVGWYDPDGYTGPAMYILDHPGRWFWIRDVVQFLQYLKAPLYPAFLVGLGVAWPSAYPANAAVIQVLLGTVSGYALFKIGESLHSSRAGLIAAALLTFHLPGFSTTFFLQETVFIPLSLVAFAIWLRASLGNGSLWQHALAGVLFGLTALTRSLPLYYLPVALALQVWAAPDRRLALRRAGVLMLAFFGTILPYSVFISSRWGQWVFVDTQGMRAIVERFPSPKGSWNPGMVEAVTKILEEFVRDPVAGLLERADRAKGFFQLKGGQWLQLYAPIRATEGGALATKILAHLTHDLPNIVTFLLAPFGFVLARRPHVAAWLAAWPLVALSLMIAFLWGGARYTASFWPQMALATGVVLAGGWRRPSRLSLALAAVCAVIIAIPVANSLGQTAAGRLEYGVRFERWGAAGTQLVKVTGHGGFNVRPAQGRVELDVTPLDRPGTGPMAGFIEVRADGVRVASIRVTAGKTDRVTIEAQSGMVFVEIRLLSPAGDRLSTTAVTDVEVPVGTVNRMG